MHRIWLISPKPVQVIVQKLGQILTGPYNEFPLNLLKFYQSWYINKMTIPFVRLGLAILGQYGVNFIGRVYFTAKLGDK